MEGQNPNDELYPIAVLIDELKVRAHTTESQAPLTRGSTMTSSSD